MEGVPRVPMMSFPMRRSADTPHFKSRLKSFISNHYNEDPDSYGNEINELESLRASAVHVSKDYSGCSTLKKFFCQLNFLKSRFPMNEGGTCAISFSWYDVFSDTVHGWSDVDFEMSCILYNIGALHSELGALDNRQNADGMKTSCTHFQCAAWAFSHLRHNYQKFFTPDVSPDMLNILMNVCLAQAQECILEKSLIDNRKSTITAKVALQIVEYYSTALRIIDGMLKDATQYSDKLIKAVKKWRKLVEMKVHYYACIAYLYRGMQAEDQGKWGERVTMYKAAADKLNECIKLGKNMEKTDAVHDTLHFTLDVVGGKVAIAEKENEFIYHEKVPDLETVMSDVKAVSLVKGIQFKFDDLQVAGADIFGRLVPMEAHEASSLYSEEKAKVLRTYSRKIEEKNETLDKFIIPLQLEQLELHDSDKIPQELMDCCAALSVNQDAVKRLSELMSRLSSLFHDVEANLEEIQDHLTDQEKREKEYQEVVGKRPPNNIINEMTRELQKYQSAQAVAAESNKTLHEAMVVHVANLTILMKPLDDVMKHIPKYEELEKNEEALERMKKLAGKVSEMRKQREMLESQLRDSILNDDITKSLVVKKGEDLDTVFTEELQKHDKITQVLDQNLLAQENIVRALTEANAEYAETRRATVDLEKKRDKVIQSFLHSYEAYDELTGKCNKGIEFYQKLNLNVEKLLARVKSVCKVQNEERDSNMDRIIRKAQHPLPTPIPNNSSAGYNNMPGFAPGIPGSSFPAAPYSAPSNVPSSSVPPTQRPSAGGHLKLKDYLAMKKEGATNAELAASMNLPHAQQPLPRSSYGPSGQMGTPAQISGTPPINPQMQHQLETPYNSGYNPADSLGIGVRPAPVGSEDAGKDSTCNAYQNQQHYINYNTHTAPTPSSYSVSAPVSSAAYPNQSNYGQGYTANSSPLPHSYQQQIPSVSYQQHTPIPPQLLHNSVPPSNQPVAPVNYVNQHQPAVAAQPVPSLALSYTPNQPSYNPASSMNTTPYTSVYSSTQYPTAAGGAKQSEGNTYSSGYGTPLSFSGAYQNSMTIPPATNTPPPQPAYPAAAATPPVATPSSVPPNQNASLQSSQAYYSPVYHPSANTSTNATYSTGTKATPAASASVPPENPTQHTPVATDTNSSYSQTSFLAQYVRQNQGYLSSKTEQPQANPVFPSAVNYGTDQPSNYPQPQQQVGYPQNQSNSSANHPYSPYQQHQHQLGSQQNANQQWHQLQPSQQASSQNPQLQAQPQQQQSTYAPPTDYSACPAPHVPHYGQTQPQQPTFVQQPPVASQHQSPQPQQQQYQVAANNSTNQAQTVTPVPPKSSFGGSNLDLLSDIDFNVMPAVEPLAPVVLPTSISEKQATDPPTMNQEVNKVDSPVSSLPSSSSLSPPASNSTPSVQEIPSLPHFSNNKVSERKGSATATADPFQDPLALEKFAYEVEKLENTVEGLAKKSLNGPTLRLDLKWKELLDVQNATSVKRSISVARCYPMKNRFPDIMPYDQTRVPIPNTKDDYINASFVNDLSPAAYPLIATQAPMPSTMADFWHMIWQHYVELVVCLCSDVDLKEQAYWPIDKGASFEYGVIKVVLQSRNNKFHFVERIFSISNRELKQSRVVVHLQFLGWPGHTFPVSPGPLVGFVKEVSGYYHQQRNLAHPVVVHCVSGVGKTGVFSVLSAAIQEIDSGHGMPDVLQIAATASEQRKGVMNDKEYLRFAYHSLLYYCQDILMKRGILSAKSTFEEKPKKSHIRHPSQDFLQDISLTKLLDKVNNTDDSGSSKDSSAACSMKSSPAHRQQGSFSSLSDAGGGGTAMKQPRLSYSDVPESLTNIDPTTFRANSCSNSTEDLVNSKKQAFESNRGALFDRAEDKIEDPLSSLDPLWTLKK